MAAVVFAFFSEESTSSTKDMHIFRYLCIFYGNAVFCNKNRIK